MLLTLWVIVAIAFFLLILRVIILTHDNRDLRQTLQGEIAAVTRIQDLVTEQRSKLSVAEEQLTLLRIGKLRAIEARQHWENECRRLQRKRVMKVVH